MRILLATIALACTIARADDTSRRPNIVWIVGENFDLDFGCYGASKVHTPNVDSLAATGIRYTNAFSTSPVCAPSRSALMTGMYATTTGMHPMRSHRNDSFRLPDGVVPLTHRLQQAGYQTANVTHIGDKIVGTGKLDLNFVNEGELYQTKIWSEIDTKNRSLPRSTCPRPNTTFTIANQARSLVCPGSEKNGTQSSRLPKM